MGDSTGRVDEIYIFEIDDDKIVSANGVEDHLSRMQQLGLGPA
ncbi:MAG TPA: hypothetical protein VFV02_11505 [Acidimicrobiales bacterium]|nr:hypothetical protein [Acidimicrobiales bacterium]